MENRMMRNFWIITWSSLLLFSPVEMFNGELAELECPEECECHYFRVNWVTDCSESNLTQIPYSELSSNVYILDLNGNYITDVKPFPPDIKMRRLQLAYNLMTEVRRESFAELNYLIDVDFANNKIKKIDAHTFEGTSGFIALELQDNPLDTVYGPFLYSSTLLYLDISNCGLKELNPAFFRNITSLSTLDLSGNPLKIIQNKVFYPLKTLETLKLNECNLTFIDNSAFAAQSNLKHLELARNMFTVVPWESVFMHLIRLEYVDLRNSKLTHLPVETFKNTLYMRTLILAENELHDLDVASTIGQRLTQLDTLDLSLCHLTKPLSEDAFVNSTKIRTLYLSGNTLFASDLLVALSPLVKLQKLSLSHCGLSQLPDTLHKFTSLIELDISYNPLNDVFVKIIAPLETLQYLNMGHSNLQHIAANTFSKMTSMKRLILSGNDLNSLEAGLFANLTHLESLELNSCGLMRPLNAPVFFNNLTYTDLTELQLSRNPLTVSSRGPLLPKQLSRLLKLDLSYCNLTFLPTDAFHFTRNITDLILTGNLFTMPADLLFLELLPRLEIIDLRFNNLSTLSPSDMPSNVHVKKLKLLGNPWTCDCYITELWQWALANKGNLEILDGATIGPEHITVGKTKRKKLLTCNYEALPKPISNKNVLETKDRPGRFLNYNRTWSKYLRESSCENPPHRKIRSAKYEAIDKKVTTQNFWMPQILKWAPICLLSICFTVYITTRRQTRKAHI